MFVLRILLRSQNCPNEESLDVIYYWILINRIFFQAGRASNYLTQIFSTHESTGTPETAALMNYKEDCNAFYFRANFDKIMVEQLLQLSDTSAGMLNSCFFLEQVRCEFQPYLNE